MFAGLWAALNHPVVFLLLLILFLLALCWLLPRIWRGSLLLARKIRALFTRERVPNT